MLVKISHRNMVGSPRERFSTFTPSSGASTWVRNCGRSFSYSTYWDDCLILRSGNSKLYKKELTNQSKIPIRHWSEKMKPPTNPWTPTAYGSLYVGSYPIPLVVCLKRWHDAELLNQPRSECSSAPLHPPQAERWSRSPVREKALWSPPLSWFFSSQNLAKFGFYSLGMGTSTWK